MIKPGVLSIEGTRTLCNQFIHNVDELVEYDYSLALPEPYGDEDERTLSVMEKNCRSIIPDGEQLTDDLRALPQKEQYGWTNEYLEAYRDFGRQLAEKINKVEQFLRKHRAEDACEKESCPKVAEFFTSIQNLLDLLNVAAQVCTQFIKKRDHCNASQCTALFLRSFQQCASRHQKDENAIRNNTPYARLLEEQYHIKDFAQGKLFNAYRTDPEHFAIDYAFRLTEHDLIALVLATAYLETNGRVPTSEERALFPDADNHTIEHNVEIIEKFPYIIGVDPLTDKKLNSKMTFYLMQLFGIENRTAFLQYMNQCYEKLGYLIRPTSLSTFSKYIPKDSMDASHLAEKVSELKTKIEDFFRTPYAESPQIYSATLSVSSMRPYAGA